jgi:hypothetical protein
LIAELGAAFLCAEFSIDGDPHLPRYIEGDSQAFFTAHFWRFWMPILWLI